MFCGFFLNRGFMFVLGFSHSLFMSFIGLLMFCGFFLNRGFMFVLGFSGLVHFRLVLVCTGSLLLTFRRFMISLSQCLLGCCYSRVALSIHCSAIGLPSLHLYLVVLCLRFMQLRFSLFHFLLHVFYMRFFLHEKRVLFVNLSLRMWCHSPRCGKSQKCKCNQKLLHVVYVDQN